MTQKSSLPVIQSTQNYVGPAENAQADFMDDVGLKVMSNNILEDALSSGGGGLCLALTNVRQDERGCFR